MHAFDLAAIPPVHAGAGRRRDVGALLAPLAGAGPVLVVADPGLAATGLTDEVERSLAAAGFVPSRFSDFSGDPSSSAADAAASVARRSGARAVVALGGGSALDLAKAVAGIAPGDDPAMAYGLCARPFPPAPLPLIAIPTTSGTGSELTRTAILSDVDKAKVWLWGSELKPRAVILDPEATVSLPAGLTAATGIDALVHALEAATNRNANEANGLFAFEAIRLVTAHLPRAVASGDDLPARAAVQRGAALAGIAIDNGGTAVAHNIGHALASIHPIHHGRAVAIGFAATLAWNIAADDGRFAAAARAMGLDAAVDLPKAFIDLCHAVGLDLAPGKAFEDVDAARLAAQMARPENAAMRSSNFRPIGDADLADLAAMTLAQG